MYKYSKQSLQKLETVHPDLQAVFDIVIMFFDNTIIWGHRTDIEQFNLYKKGRVLDGGEWKVFDKSKVVTNCDGYKVKSDHQYKVSYAVDAVPYPELYSDKEKALFFAGFVVGVAKILKEQGVIEHDVRSGMDFNDPNHFFIKKK